jgi:transposase-like protein
MNMEAFYEALPTQQDCLCYLEGIRWKGSVDCPYCHSSRISRLRAQKRLHCNACNTSFSATVNTPFHHTHIPLQKCFYAAWLLINSKKRVTGRMLSKQLGVSKDAACKLLLKLDMALHNADQRMIIHSLAGMGGNADGKES